MNEAQTRLDHIDPALKAAGWGVVEGTRIRVEFPITAGRLIGGGKRKQPLQADYVLEYRNKRLAIVEAKARDLHYTEGVGQAKDYAERLNIRYTYATNGLKIYGVDMGRRHGGRCGSLPDSRRALGDDFPLSPRKPTKRKLLTGKLALKQCPLLCSWAAIFHATFQHVAIEKTLDAIAAKQQRILLTMATGTGKTATAFHICWKLFQAKWNLRRDGSRSPRILFLADRNLLADQAFNAFGEFDDDALVRIKPKDIKKKGKVPTNGSVFFTIFQSFMASDQSESEAEQAQEQDEAQGEGLAMAAEDHAVYTSPNNTSRRSNPISASMSQTSLTSSSSTSATVAVPMTRAAGVASWITSLQPCSSA